MLRDAATRRALARGAVCVAAVALAFVETGSNLQGFRATAESPAPLQPDPERWTLSIDGWVIRVDGIAPGAAAEPGGAEPAAISAWDHLIRRHAGAEGLDWRLVAALISEESGFQENAVSTAGAYGLMQVRAIAAEAVGEEEFEQPEDNVRTGVRYLKQLEKRFSTASGTDRLALVLAAYHMGPSHVDDARKLARRFGYDPNRWENSMDLILPLLQEPEFYEQLPYGYAQGRATVLHVYRILSRYEIYRARAAAG